MTNEQFDILLNHLKEIKESIDSLKGEPNSKHKYDLSDVYSEIFDVKSAVDSVESAIGNLRK